MLRARQCQEPRRIKLIILLDGPRWQLAITRGFCVALLLCEGCEAVKRVSKLGAHTLSKRVVTSFLLQSIHFLMQIG